jgi:hypothetical protein
MFALPSSSSPQKQSHPGESYLISLDHADFVQQLSLTFHYLASHVSPDDLLSLINHDSDAEKESSQIFSLLYFHEKVTNSYS